MDSWQERVKEYNRLGYKYLGLSATGMMVYSEWETLDGKIVRIYYDD